MPLDPQECRRQALACVRLAQTSISPEARLHYANLAKSWLTLAGDLDERNAQLKSEPEKKPDSAAHVSRNESAQVH
jgi:hypothetical protein